MKVDLRQTCDNSAEALCRGNDRRDSGSSLSWIGTRHDPYMAKVSIVADSGASPDPTETRWGLKLC
jgi:hypothetical protein